MAEPTVPFGKADSADMTGRVYVERAPIVASWYQEDEGPAKTEEIAKAIGAALGRKVEIVDARHDGDGQYSCVVRRLEDVRERLSIPGIISRLRVGLSAISLDEEVLSAFRAAYLVLCDVDHRGESMYDKDTRYSIRSALDAALRHQGGRPAHLPEIVRDRLGATPLAFLETLIDVVGEVDQFTLALVPRFAEGVSDLNDDAGAKEFIVQCLWGYVGRIGLAIDPF